MSYKDILKSFAWFAAIAVMIATLPALAVLVGWLVGFLAELILGARLADWLNMALDTERFVKGDIAKITGILGLVALIFAGKSKGKSE